MSDLTLRKIDVPDLNNTYYVPQLDGTLATAFSTSATYAVGDLVVYNRTLYKCTTAASAGAWNASNWTAVTMSSEISNLKNDLDSLKNATLTDILSLGTSIGNYYITADGNLSSSTSWIAYSFDLSICEPKYVSLWTNNAAFYAIAYYSSDSFSSSTLVGGTTFGTTSSSEFDDLNAPSSAKYAVVANRTATSMIYSVKGYQLDIASELSTTKSSLSTVGSKLDSIISENTVDVISEFGIYGNYYIRTTGELVTSSSWTTYSVPVDCYNFTAHTINAASSGYLQIAFYNSTVPSTSTFLNGITFIVANEYQDTTISSDDFPTGTKLILVTNRTPSGTSHTITMTTRINNTVDSLEKTIESIAGYSGSGNVKNVFSGLVTHNDITVIGEELWMSEIEYSDGEETGTTIIHRYKIVDDRLSYLSDISTDFGHLNVMDYCEENDCLIFGNGANDVETSGNWFAVVPHPLDLGTSATLANDAIIYSVDIGFKVQAMWGDDNFGQYNEVILISNNLTTMTKVLLTVDSNGDFDGGFVTLETLTSNTAYTINGADYWGDTIYAGVAVDNGYGLLKISASDFSEELITKKMYQADGTAFSGGTQGICINRDYLWIASNTSADTNYIKYIVQYNR